MNGRWREAACLPGEWFPWGRSWGVFGFPVLVTILLQPVLKRRFLVRFGEESVTAVGLRAVGRTLSSPGQGRTAS